MLLSQLELHVYNPQHELLSYLKEKKIVPQAYSPLGSSNAPLLKDGVVVEIATKHSLQPSDILLGYLRMVISRVAYRGNNKVHLFFLVAKGIVVLSKSVTPDRIKSNFTGALDAAIKLSVNDLEKLDGLAASGKQKR